MSPITSPTSSSATCRYRPRATIGPEYRHYLYGDQPRHSRHAVRRSGTIASSLSRDPSARPQRLVPGRVQTDVGPADRRVRISRPSPFPPFPDGIDGARFYVLALADLAGVPRTAASRATSVFNNLVGVSFEEPYSLPQSDRLQQAARLPGREGRSWNTSRRGTTPPRALLPVGPPPCLPICRSPT